MSTIQHASEVLPTRTWSVDPARSTIGLEVQEAAGQASTARILRFAGLRIGDVFKRFGDRDEPSLSDYPDALPPLGPARGMATSIGASR